MRRVVVLFTLFFFFSVFHTSAQTDFYTKQWQRVYKYELKVLPKSALGVVDTIYRRAKADQNITEATKALLYQSKFALLLSEDAELNVVNRWKNEIRTAPAPFRNILESMLASMYWEYFQAHRYDYYSRTTVNGKLSDDFRTWDAQTLFREIHIQFQNSLKPADVLRKIKIETLSELVVEAEYSQLYRPFLYDLLVHNAVSFYQTGEGSFVQQRILFNTKGYESFGSVTARTMDSVDWSRYAINLYQEALAYHKAQRDTAAIVSLELEALKWMNEVSMVSLEPSQYTDILRYLKHQYKHHSSSALIDFELALYWNTLGSTYEKGNPEYQFLKKDAAALCRQTIATFPDSHGALQCQSLLNNILAPHVNLKTENFIPVLTPARMLIEYTNLDNMNFSVYKIDTDFERSLRDQSDSVKIVRIGKLNTVHAWTSRLKSSGDFQAHSTEVTLPPLSVGRYLIVARVPDPSSTAFKQTFAYATIQVTNLALLETEFDYTHRFQVVNRVTGKPVINARLKLNKWSLRESVFTTDKNGFVTLPASDGVDRNVTVSVEHDQDYATFRDYYLYQRYRPNEDGQPELNVKSFIFTDRSIYRPGQTVFFKGILIQTKNKKSSVVKGEHVEVYFEDVNGTEVGMLRLKTNSFGSFSGEFKIPASGLTGEYTLYADEDSEYDSKLYDDEMDDFDYQETEISVEEYKRPSFEISFKPVTQSFRLNDRVILSGSATAFNGASLSNAKVKYVITRNQEYSRKYHAYSYSQEELFVGDTLIGPDGNFAIAFTAKPDERVLPENLPVFTYSVKVEVTDISGETRTAQARVKAGYHTLTVGLDAPSILDRKIPNHTLTVTSNNLNGQPVPAKGLISIYKLDAPQHPQRKRPWEAPDLPVLTEDEFANLFPHDPYRDVDDQDDSRSGKLVYEVPFNTARTAAINLVLTKKWQLGNYRVTITAQDTSGYKILNSYPVAITESDNNDVSDNQMLVLRTDKDAYTVGELATLTVGSASPDISITLDVQSGSGPIRSSVEHFSATSRTFTIPVTESMQGGFSVQATAVNYNGFFRKEKEIQVVRTINTLTFETITFKDKLQPGASTTWSFEVKGVPANKDAEVLASMYDASLDQFKPHSWFFDPHENDDDYNGQMYVHSEESFGTQSFTEGNRFRAPHIFARRFYDRFDWYAFGITRSKYLQDNYLYRLYSTKSAPEKPSHVKLSAERNMPEGIVTGIVVGPDGRPLAGVSVSVVGTQRGIITDVLGKYWLEATKGERLQFSFVGMNPAEATVGRKNIIDVFMEEDVTQLSEVVVTAGGLTVQRRELGYQATTVKATVFSDEFEIEEVTGGLSGKVPGLLVSATSSGVNRNYRVVLRGQRSLTGNNQAVYVVDGIIVDGLTVSEDDIVNITALAGKAAVARYGSAASNGAIIVTTRSGQRKLDEQFAKVNVRKNFNETAFFFPHLITNELGRIRFSFTTPESLTRWKMQLLAHTDDLRIGKTLMQTVTQKELMITPNVPRFLREGDEMILSAKITNLTGQKKEGFAALQLVNALTGEPVDAHFGNTSKNVKFKVAARQNTEVSWKLVVPAGIEAVQYKIMAKAGSFSDGEQNILPVLSNRIIVTETLPLNVRAGQTRTFSLDKLKASASASTLKHQSLTLEVTSNPAWYAVRAMPYLMEYPHECAEQLFSRYYANALATHVVNSNPKIKQVFDRWASSGALISNLEKNPELKSILLNETPWVREAESETEQQKRIALLFDLQAMSIQQSAVISRLGNLQLDNGGFPWFAGGYASEYITRHIAAGFGHLRKLGVVADVDMLNLIKGSVSYTDQYMVKDYTWSLNHGGAGSLDNDIVHYLYMRSFFPELPLNAETKAAVDHYLALGTKSWMTLDLYAKGMMALVQFRNNNVAVAHDILNSLRETSITSEELGMYWKENRSGWYWHQSPVETQTLMIEAFSEIESANPSLNVQTKNTTVDELRIWLLKNKQASQWKTTRATSEAIYALLLNGSDWLSGNAAAEIQLGGKKVVSDTSQAEAGTGYFKTSWTGESITPAMGDVKVTNPNTTGILWGGLYWQYSEQLDRITPAETSLKLSKKVFKIMHGNAGESMTEVTDSVRLVVGDLLRVRIELRSDRDMEFIHMKDMRAAGLEPVDVLSEYKWQEGLGYYQSTKDASTNFFFDRIPKGVYVFEYDLRVNAKGNYSNGITTLQCMYAPEFSSHSEGIRISVK